MKRSILFSFILFLFFQCKTGDLDALKRSVDDSYKAKFNNYVFHESRKLLYESLSPAIMQNDTIIFLERFESSLGNYWCTIYESNNKQTRQYVAQKSIRNGIVHIDSLTISKVPDKILKMVQRGDLDEVKKRGNATTITPAATLIINIGVKNIKKKKFNFSTLITQEFSTYEDK